MRSLGARKSAAQIRAWKGIRYRRMNYPNWPPPNSSPLHPIEPWGRQLFVFNAYPTIRESDWIGACGPYPRLSPQTKSLDIAGESIFDRKAPSKEELLKRIKADPKSLTKPTRTLLCATDYARRPLLFLSRSDFELFVKHLPELKKQLNDFKNVIEPNRLEERYWMRRTLLPYPTFTMQRQKKGEHNSYGVKKGVVRERKT